MVTAATSRGEEFISPLEIDGMKGRVMHIPSKDHPKREIMILYGHHALLERWWGLAENLSDYGTVTMPDIPGFGGMDSFYSIGKAATLDNYADYLAKFIKQHYGETKFGMLAISYGFLVATRMFQRHPELTKQVKLFVSAGGFMHASDFRFSRRRYYAYLILSSIFQWPPLHLVFRYLALNSFVLRLAYSRTNNARYKFAEVENDKDRFRRMMDMEVELWQKNEVRTYMHTTVELLTVDNTHGRVDIPVWHVFSPTDHFFDQSRTEAHMRQVYKDFVPLPTKLKTHTLSVLATKEDAGSLITDKLRKAIEAL